MKVKFIYYLFIISCLFCNCSNEKENMIEKTIYESIVFSYPDSFYELSEQMIDSLLTKTILCDVSEIHEVTKSKYIFKNKNEGFKTFSFYKYVDDNDFSVEELANMLIDNTRITNINSKISIIDWDKDKITITSLYNVSEDSLIFDFTSYFILNNEIFNFKYNILNSKENIDTITPYKILETIRKK